MFKPTDHDLASRGLLISTQVARSAQSGESRITTGEIKIDRPGSEKEPQKYYHSGMSPKLDEQWRVFFNTVDEDERET